MVVVDGKPVRLQLCDMAGQVSSSSIHTYRLVRVQQVRSHISLSRQKWGLVDGSINVSPQ